MFTGIIEEIGRVEAVEPAGDDIRLRVSGAVVTSDAGHGDSIAVNGVCLTVVELGGGSGGPDGAPGWFTADVMPETLTHSSLGALEVGSPVNLERAVRAGGRLGGHIVQGHVDGVGEVLARTPGDRWEVVRVGVPAELARYVVHKGSVTLDGVSLTVSDLSDAGASAPWLEVSLIPETLTRTTLGDAPVGTTVNVEVDVVAKYVEKMVGATR
ncbi:MULTISPECIES: riboflavin synthase [Kytococcus]|uniref:Riboflavin synthase n=1 Tax=Kytococcus schroeteri TaxID=138300 RepID=A0A2I1P8X3_9MICO|nr:MULTISPECIES: riboflavin synthase [Kytococcus]OFS15660.1 riboflavin synthase subunit alpha [Kytococcus sp. HMSC28H12]PKZ41084.1 riboflavin synthase [Kytococcus schroeteri]